MRDLADRLVNRVQLTSDGHKSYLDAVERAFGDNIDYAMLVKHYGPAPEGAQRRYSPAECVGTTVGTVTGQPDRKHVSTSYVERANLSIRMGNRRFTRLTNAFSKKLENHIYGLAIYFMGTPKNGPLSDLLSMEPDVSWFRRGLVGAGSAFGAS